MTPLYAAYIGLILARVGVFVAVMPPFANRTPRTVRAAFAIALTAFYFGSATPACDAAFLAAAQVEIHPVRYAIALLRESLIGASMGFAFALFLLPARLAGEFITAQIGLNAAPSASPTGPDGGGPITVTLETLSGMLFLVADGHHVVLLALHASFTTMPLGGTMLPQVGPLLSGLSNSYEAGLLLAGPLALCLFLLSVCLAIMTRAAPQLNVYSIGFALQVIVVLLGLLFLLPEIVRGLALSIGRNADGLPMFLPRS
jgi:flagellar biosynthesis protein FliR